MNALRTISPAFTGPAALRQSLLTDRTLTLTQIYQHTFPMVLRHVQRHGGSAQDAQDVFHDALVVFYEKVVAGTLVLTARPSTYLVGVCRNLWRRELERRQRNPHTYLTNDLAQLPDTESTPATDLSVLEYVELLGEKCRDLLLSFYYFQQPLAQIATARRYASVRSATVQKFKCLERLRGAIRGVLSKTLAE